MWGSEDAAVAFEPSPTQRLDVQWRPSPDHATWKLTNTLRRLLLVRIGWTRPRVEDNLPDSTSCVVIAFVRMRRDVFYDGTEDAMLAANAPFEPAYDLFQSGPRYSPAVCCRRHGASPNRVQPIAARFRVSPIPPSSHCVIGRPSVAS